MIFMERELILEKTGVMNAVIGYGKDIPRDNFLCGNYQGQQISDNSLNNLSKTVDKAYAKGIHSISKIDELCYHRAHVPL